ncbi:ATP/GTP-binding protein [Variovorax sp. dw_308]|nr:ATP-binding protein [Variovorax sp. dw_308]
MSFSNFGSFVEQTDLSLRLTRRDAVLGWDRTTKSGQRVSTAMAALGANGSGKTTMLNVGAFLARFIRDSFEAKPDTRLPFVNHLSHAKEPSRFELVTEDSEGTQWDYNLVCTTTRVISESLKRRPLEGNRRAVFTREWNEKTSAYVITQPGVEGLPLSEAKKVRGNSSFISWARQYGVEVAPGLLEGRAVTNLLRNRTRATGEFASLVEASNQFQAAPSTLQSARDLLLRLDLGLSDLQLQALSPLPTAAKVAGGSPAEEPQSYFPYGEHASAGNVFLLPFSMESAGTRSAFVLLRFLLEALETGAPAFIDEFDATLHPHMLEPLLRLFSDEATNPLGAQLIFTVQSPEVLALLKPPQVTFVEKIDCVSSAYRGDEIGGLRATDNMHGKYMAGALGAVPQL